LREVVGHFCPILVVRWKAVPGEVENTDKYRLVFQVWEYPYRWFRFYQKQ